MSKRKRLKNNLPEEEQGAILRYFRGRRNEMYQWLYDNLPPLHGVKVVNNQLVIFEPSRYMVNYLKELSRGLKEM